MLECFIDDDFNKTLKHFNESIRLQPEDGKNHYFAGLINHLMGNGVGAVSHMKQAEESFVKQKQVKNIADVRKHLRVYQNHYGIPGIQGDGSSIASAIHRQKKYN
jgi:hypothetical protein